MINQSNFHGGLIKLVPDESKPKEFVYVVPGSWLETQRVSKLSADLLLSMACNMNDKQIINVNRLFKEEFISSYKEPLTMAAINGSVQQLSREKLTRKLMNGIYEVSKDIYLHKSAMDA